MRRLLSLAVAADCDGPRASAALAQTPPNVLVVGQIAEPKSLDPHAVTAVNDFRILVNVYDGLVRYKDGTLEVEPALAESWTISDDGTDLHLQAARRRQVPRRLAVQRRGGEVQLRPHARREPPVPRHRAVPAVFFFSSVDTVTAVDDLTVEFKLKEPYAPFLSNLAYPTGLIVSPDGGQEIRQGIRPPSVGHRRLQVRRMGSQLRRSWSPATTTTGTARRRSRRSSTGRSPTPIRASPRCCRAASTSWSRCRRTACSSSATDASLQGLRTGRAARLVPDPQHQGRPVRQQGVRQAANYAINKKALVDNILQGTADVAAGPTPPAFAWAYDDELQPYPYDPEKAKALLKEAGYDGKQVTFYVTEGGSGMLDPDRHGHGHPGRSRSGRHEGQDRDLRVEHLPRQGQSGPRRQGRHGRDGLDDQRSGHAALPGAAHRSHARTRAASIRATIPTRRSTNCSRRRARSTDQAERAKLYKQMQEIVHEDAPWVFVANWKQNAVTKASVRELQAAAVLLPDAAEGRQAAIVDSEAPAAAPPVRSLSRVEEGRAMTAYIAKRLLAAIPVLFGLTIIVFLIMAMIPGDPATAILGSYATPENVEKLNRDLGLDKPLLAAIFHLARQPAARRFRPLLHAQPAGARRGAGALLGDADPRRNVARALLRRRPAGRHRLGGAPVRLGRQDRSPSSC